MPSQRKISSVQACQIDMADDCGISPKDAHELASRQAGGSCNLGYTRIDHKNYLRTKRQRNMMYGEAGSIVRYFTKKTAENPSFYSAIQLDCDEKITNLFWADAKMLIDYAYFGDVITFDTTFGTNKDCRPLGVFVGLNQFREMVIFGATLLYDETESSFKWLFEAFLEAHKQKHPRTIYTDQDMAMKNAISVVFLESWHGLCSFHIMQNAVKHLARTGRDESSALAELSACMYEYEDVNTFEKSFSTLRSKVKNDTWLGGLYQQKEKWAECYMKNVFTLGMRSTQLSESLNKDMKDVLKCDLDIARFFTHFERVVASKRDKELDAEYNSRKKLPRIHVRTPMLIQASNMYTACIFEAFQVEYERSLAAYARPMEKPNEFTVGVVKVVDGKTIMEKEYKVEFDPPNEMVCCSCRQFERVGILCCHALKVLDMMNIKVLPEHYILKRWTREARCGSIQDIRGDNVIENPKIDATRRYQNLARKFLSLASRAADYEEIYSYIDNVLDTLHRDVDEKIKNTPNELANQPKEQTTIAIPEEYSHITGLKKKVVKKRTSRRQRTWYDKLHRASQRQRQRSQNMPEDNPSVFEGFGSFTSFTELLLVNIHL